MSPMALENVNDVEVGESLPPATEHVSQKPWRMKHYLTH